MHTAPFYGVDEASQIVLYNLVTNTQIQDIACTVYTRLTVRSKKTAWLLTHNILDPPRATTPCHHPPC